MVENDDDLPEFCKARVMLNGHTFECMRYEAHTEPHACYFPVTQMDIDSFEWDIDDLGRVMLDCSGDAAVVVFLRSGQPMDADEASAIWGDDDD
jgi:hypothetical protein